MTARNCALPESPSSLLPGCLGQHPSFQGKYSDFRKSWFLTILDQSCYVGNWYQEFHKFVQVQGNVKSKILQLHPHSRPNEPKINVQILNHGLVRVDILKLEGKKWNEEHVNPRNQGYHCGPKVTMPVALAATRSNGSSLDADSTCHIQEQVPLSCVPSHHSQKSKHTSHMSSNVSDYIHIKYYKIIPDQMGYTIFE